MDVSVFAYQAPYGEPVEETVLSGFPVATTKAVEVDWHSLDDLERLNHVSEKARWMFKGGQFTTDQASEFHAVAIAKGAPAGDYLYSVCILDLGWIGEVLSRS